MKYAWQYEEVEDNDNFHNSSQNYQGKYNTTFNSLILLDKEKIV